MGKLYDMTAAKEMLLRAKEELEDHSKYIDEAGHDLVNQVCSLFVETQSGSSKPTPTVGEGRKITDLFSMPYFATLVRSHSGLRVKVGSVEMNVPVVYDRDVRQFVPDSRKEGAEMMRFRNAPEAVVYTIQSAFNAAKEEWIKMQDDG
jgi:hypothetical protein